MCIFKKNNKQNEESETVFTQNEVYENNDNGNERTFTFSRIPATLDELKARPEATLDDPYKTAALIMCALCVYSRDRETGKAMLNYLRGPQQPLSPMQISFLNDRFMDNGKYIPFSYFQGAKPDNDYTPAQPYRLTISATNVSFPEESRAKLFLTSGGADSPRSLEMRRASGRWFMWEQFVMVGIKDPKSQNPWG